MYGASSIAGTALAAALLSGAFARRIALSTALGSGAIGSLLVVHGENWSVFAASVLVGLGLVASPSIVTFLIATGRVTRPIPSSLRSPPRAWVSVSSADLRSADFCRLARTIGHRLVRRRDLRRRHACRSRRRLLRRGRGKAIRCRAA